MTSKSGVQAAAPAQPSCRTSHDLKNNYGKEEEQLSVICLIDVGLNKSLVKNTFD